MNSWTDDEVRKIRFLFKTLIIIFDVSGSQKDEFQKYLFDYFSFVEKSEGIIHDVEETVDSSTGIAHQLSISIACINQHLLIQELQLKFQQFKAHIINNEPR